MSFVPKACGDLAPRPRDVPRHHERDRVAERAADERVGDARVAGGRVDDLLAGLELLRADRVLDHLVARAVLDGAARVEELALGPELDAGGLALEGLQADDRRVTDEVGDALGDAQARAAQRLHVRELVGGGAEDVGGVAHWKLISLPEPPQAKHSGVQGRSCETASPPSSGTRRWWRAGGARGDWSIAADQDVQRLGGGERSGDDAGGALGDGDRRDARHVEGSVRAGAVLPERHDVDDVLAALLAAHDDEGHAAPDRGRHERVVVEVGAHDQRDAVERRHPRDAAGRARRVLERDGGVRGAERFVPTLVAAPAEEPERTDARGGEVARGRLGGQPVAHDRRRARPRAAPGRRSRPRAARAGARSA